MRTIIVDGRLGKDAEILQTKDGRPFVKFSIANNDFVDGQEVTDWFDILSYDTHFAEKRAQYLKKGMYVIVEGKIRSKVNTSPNGNMYLNHHVMATNIDMPRLGRGGTSEEQQSSEEPEVSVYTGGTRSSVTAKQSEPQIAPAYVAADNGNSDDLPF